ncbi:hypothetical protein [Parabacteroides sp. PF5-6]|uniref:hypothetical protein n=1 Tax=Parabacteroides sp. PF5-6 TaxID=1742403 RepID=UPI002404A8A6|nr:hypothetical protein [Parabacteroides sp. PF5-6]MDF9831424.1 hypothetical protein [Parabacteroides sp. PF5-6]
MNKRKDNMKKIGLLLIATGFLFACDPVEERMDMGTMTVTEADLAKVTATPVMRDSEENPGTQVRSNYIHLNSEGIAALSSWFYGTGTFTGTNGVVQVVVPGRQTLTFTALGPDGTKLTRDIEIEVDECFDVAPQWGYLCGTGSRVWTWNEDESGAVWGNGGYIGNTAPGWWTVSIDDVGGQVAGEGKGATMEFSVVGSSFTKTRTDGSQQNGSFKFSYTGDDVVMNGDAVWAEGTLTINGASVLVGINPNAGNAPYDTYHILRLNDQYMNLCAPEPGAGSWGTAWFWQFKAK